MGLEDNVLQKPSLTPLPCEATKPQEKAKIEKRKRRTEEGKRPISLTRSVRIQTRPDPARVGPQDFGNLLTRPEGRAMTLANACNYWTPEPGADIHTILGSNSSYFPPRQVKRGLSLGPDYRSYYEKK